MPTKERTIRDVHNPARNQRKYIENIKIQTFCKKINDTSGRTGHIHERGGWGGKKSYHVVALRELNGQSWHNNRTLIRFFTHTRTYRQIANRTRKSLLLTKQHVAKWLCHRYEKLSWVFIRPCRTTNSNALLTHILLLCFLGCGLNASNA